MGKRSALVQVRWQKAFGPLAALGGKGHMCHASSFRRLEGIKPLRLCKKAAKTSVCT
jgi:hypothetical protein